MPVEEYSVAECDLGYSSEKEEDTGNISKLITDAEAYELEQYRQKMKERKSPMSRSGSGCSRRSKPDSGQSVKVRPQSGIRSRLSSTPSSDIGSVNALVLPADVKAGNTVYATHPSEELAAVPHQQHIEEAESGMSSASSTEADSVLGDSYKSQVTNTL